LNRRLFRQSLSSLRRRINPPVIDPKVLGDGIYPSSNFTSVEPAALQAKTLFIDAAG